MPEVIPSVQSIPGFRVSGVHCGLKKNGKLDFALVVSDRPCTAAGVFTTNTVKAACVQVDIEKLAHHANHIRAVAINTGSANACTGEQGIANAHSTAAMVAAALDCSQDAVLVLSTGVIGMQLPMAKIEQGVADSSASLGNNWEEAARAIMTTDTRPKFAAVEVIRVDGSSYHIAGMSKGAGMIAPNMATMLGILVTDAGLPVHEAQKSLSAAAEVSYNRIVVDGDMSTNDTVFLLANGASGAVLDSTADLAQFQDALTALCTHLAQAIVRDGEGVTKFITLHVTGAASNAAARQIANTIATSPLVKTAFFGQDANWGRIVAAAGRAGVPFDPDSARLSLAEGETLGDSLCIFAKGMPTNYHEEDAAAIMRAPSISILLECGSGNGSAVIWTCDLSHDYVTINGDYRT